MTTHTIFAEPKNGADARPVEEGVKDSDVADAVQAWIDVYPANAWHIYSLPEDDDATVRNPDVPVDEG